MRRHPALATAAILTALLVPGGGRLVRRPAVRRTEVPRLRADLYVPPGGPHPGLVLALGALREGRRYPLLERVARTVAGRGYAVLVPELGRLQHLVLGDDALDDLVAATAALPGLPGVTPGPPGLYGFSLGGSLALLAAADPRLEGRLAFVASLGGYASLTDMLVAATTTDELEAPSRFAVAASLVAEAGGADGERLAALVDAHRDDPMAALRELDRDGLGRRGRAVVELLTNREASAVPSLLAALEGARAGLDRLSPACSMDRVTIPAWILHDARDGYVPVAQALRLREAASGRPNFTFLLTDILEHTEPADPGWNPLRLATAYAPALVRLARFVHGPLATLEKER